MKWNPQTEKNPESHVPSHLFTRGNHDVTHSTGWGTMVAGRKQQVRGGRGVEGCEEALFYLPWILCFGPSACSTKTLVGSSPPILSIPVL